MVEPSGVAVGEWLGILHISTEKSGKVNKQGSGSDAICEREGRCRPRVIYPKDRDEREDSPSQKVSDHVGVLLLTRAVASPSIRFW